MPRRGMTLDKPRIARQIRAGRGTEGAGEICCRFRSGRTQARRWSCSTRISSSSGVRRLRLRCLAPRLLLPRLLPLPAAAPARRVIPVGSARRARVASSTSASRRMSQANACATFGSACLVIHEASPRSPGPATLLRRRTSVPQPRREPAERLLRRRSRLARLARLRFRTLPFSAPRERHRRACLR